MSNVASSSVLPANKVWGKAIFSQAFVCPQGVHLDRDPPGQRLPWTENPWTETPWTETPPGQRPPEQRPTGQRPPGQRPPWTETPLDRDPPGQRPSGQRPPWTETPLDGDPLGQRPPWTETSPHTVKSGRYASYWNAFLFHIHADLETIVQVDPRKLVAPSKKSMTVFI